MGNHNGANHNLANHYDVLIAGGGTAGICVAARLRKASPKLKIAIIEPSEKHFYQPLWTLVGAGASDLKDTVRAERDLIPSGVTWICDSVKEFLPETNEVLVAKNHRLSYSKLVVAVGLQSDWEKIKGLSAAIGKEGVCSNYSVDTVQSTWKFISEFKGGNAVFTFPNTPVKCGGAPQKIMYLAEHAFRNQGVREKSKVSFYSAAATIFAVPKYANALTKVIEKRGIETHFKNNLIEVDAGKKMAILEHVETKLVTEVPYDLIHVTPPMSAPDVVKKSGLAGSAGWVDVNKETLQHVKYPNVFSLGDVSNLPTSKTGAAIRKQAPVLVENLLQTIQGKACTAKYNGYTSCPLVTGYGKLILAEFDYDGKPQESFPFDQSKERFSMYFLKKHLLPRLYWQGMMKGRA